MRTALFSLFSVMLPEAAEDVGERDESLDGAKNVTAVSFVLKVLFCYYVLLTTKSTTLLFMGACITEVYC